MPGADQSGASQGYTIHMVKKSFNSQDVGQEQQQKKKKLRCLTGVCFCVRWI